MLWSSRTIDVLDPTTMSNVTSLTLNRLNRRIEMLECSLYALNLKLEEFEVENATQSEVYTMLFERREIVQESLDALRECIASLRKFLH
jgi:hypothetical protein